MKFIHAIQKYDVCLFIWYINTTTRATLVKLCRYISMTGDGPLYGLLCVYLYGRYGWNNPTLQVLLLGFALERPLYFMLKNGFKRNRPANALLNFQSLIIPSDHFSFPSGHTSAAFLVATAIGYFYSPLLLAGYLWASLIGFSRVTLGVHFPTDTLMGGILGAGTAITAIGIIGS